MTKGKELTPKAFLNSLRRNPANNAKSHQFRNLMELARESQENASDPPLPAMGRSPQGGGTQLTRRGQLDALGYLQGSDVLG